MKIVLVSSFVPFINGGARFIVEWLEQQLALHGHQVERFYLPFVDRPQDLLEQMAAYRLIDLSASADRIICFRPPAYVLPHPNKILWFIHHIRVFYDLWDTEYRPVKDDGKGRALRRALIDFDTKMIAEAKAVYTNSRVVGQRLLKFNQIQSKVLYPPIFQPERFFNAGFGDSIVSICRLEPHKRQHLMVEAMRYVKTDVKLQILGRSSNPQYVVEMRRVIRENRLGDKVSIVDGWISEAEKARLLSTCVAVAYLPLDEDSYGYPSLEGAHSCKPVVTTRDSGGVLELIEDGRNGFVAVPDARHIAAAFDQMFLDRARSKQMGVANAERLKELNINWHHVVEAMTS